MDYAFKYEGKAFTPNQSEVKDIAAHNAALEAQELAHWATAPDLWQVYIVKSAAGYWVAQTWTGKHLGNVLSYRRYRSNFARTSHANMASVTISGTNGATYYGRYGSDWSQLCRVRKSRRT